MYLPSNSITIGGRQITFPDRWLAPWSSTGKAVEWTRVPPNHPRDADGTLYRPCDARSTFTEDSKTAAYVYFGKMVVICPASFEDTPPRLLDIKAVRADLLGANTLNHWSIDELQSLSTTLLHEFTHTYTQQGKCVHHLRRLLTGCSTAHRASDYAYAWSECANLATSHPELTVYNADTFTIFAKGKSD